MYKTQPDLVHQTSVPSDKISVAPCGSIRFVLFQAEWCLIYWGVGADGLCQVAEDDQCFNVVADGCVRVV